MSRREYALVTGASSGIGECFARALAARGHNLVLVARSKEKLDVLAEELRRQHSVQTEPLVCDLSAPHAAMRLVETLSGKELAIELLLNNAGFGARGSFWKLPLERQTQMIRLNVVALLELTHLLLPAMIESRRGGIVNVSSTASFPAMPFGAVYAATKAFVTSFSLALAEEVRRFGVRVVTLCPGGTDTNFFEAGQYGRARPPGGLQPPGKVVEAALRALDRGGGLVVPRWLNKLGVFSQRLAPRTWVAKVAGRIYRD